MPRLSTLSNPTGLVDLEKNRIGIVLDDSGIRLAFSLARLDLSELALASPPNVVVVVRRGNSEERVELGSVSAWDKSFRTLAEFSDAGTWAFRVLLVQPGSSKLIAAAENIRPEGQGDSSSFIALEAADLGQRPWEIEILELDGRAVVRFNKEIYPSPGEAEADGFFIAMLLPEAIRRVAEWIAREPARLSEPAWEPFKAWLTLHGIAEEPDPERPEEQFGWCSEVVHAFCERFEFAAQMKDLRMKKADE